MSNLPSKVVLDFSEAVPYHEGQFPPHDIDYKRLARTISTAAAALARYDGVLRSLANGNLLLAPLRRQEAVISSRIEGTVATLDEVLSYEAEQDNEDDDLQSTRSEVIEIFSYTRAMNYAQRLMDEEGLPICSRLIKAAHSRLLLLGRGADKQPGEFKTDQNYIVDTGRKKVLFVPISAIKLNEGISTFERYVNDDTVEPLIQTAISHLEFESLHPFKDGNGRVGRMLITLMLWNKGLISQPHFYVSAYLEKERDEYIDRMRAASEIGAWTEWCDFFLKAIETQARENLQIAESIRQLYEEMKERFRFALKSQHSTSALDIIFSKPVFKTSALFIRGDIAKASANRFIRLLVEGGLIRVVHPGSGRRGAIYAFDPLLNLVRS